MDGIEQLGLELTHRERLLSLAREAIRDRLTRGEPTIIEESDPVLQGRFGVFVSLYVGDELRGCIGNLYARDPLWCTVREMAVGAATADPSAVPLTLSELRALNIEISVIAPMAQIRAEDVEVGACGLYIVRGPARGVLLPQVATDHGWDRNRFLAEACAHAGLGPEDWKREGTQIYGFTADVFSDLSLG
jgi:AmmeMemoRadiSam system protein A